PGVITHIVTRFQQTHRPVTLQTCFATGCHDNKAASTKCATCHIDIQRVKPKTHTPGWLAQHGGVARKEPSGCMTCHQAAPTLMLAAQRSDVKQARFEQLLGSQFCSTCHSTKNPHPTGFERTHGELAKTSTTKCVVCHTDTKRFCDSCHKTPMPH